MHEAFDDMGEMVIVAEMDETRMSNDKGGSDYSYEQNPGGINGEDT